MSAVLCAPLTLVADVALLVGEPYGAFGSVNPTGHASVYLSAICADSPIRLRRCNPGETGVVISRYHRIGGYDWIAIPLEPYLYAVERQEDAPASVDAETVARLRDEYRRLHLRELAPDDPDGWAPKGDWIQLVGSAYDRTIYGFTLETTPEDDDRLIEHLNSRPNHRRFHLFFRNCADFSRGIINFYYPGAIRRGLVADAGISTPKHSAKRLVSYSRRRPDLRISCFSVPQVPGVRRSTRLRGVAESLVRSKKYIVPLLILQPWVAATAAVAYLSSGRFDPQSALPTGCKPHPTMVVSSR